MSIKKLFIKTIFYLALIIFIFSAYNIFKILKGYFDAKVEYNEIQDIAMQDSEEVNENELFGVRFDELLKLNSDTVGWIKFQKEPLSINYPVVQGNDNEYYLWKTFSNNENTVGSIFMDYENDSSFGDYNTIIYGHRMNNKTMFNELHNFREKDYWEENSLFDIYTLDGRRLTYQIYSVAEVTDISDIYDVTLTNEEEFNYFLKESKKRSLFDTGINPTSTDSVVTLSTCVVGNDSYRFVVHGVKVSEEII